MKSIHFFSEDIPFELKQKGKTRAWLEAIAQQYQAEIDQINYIYCSDNYLLDINRNYLNHDYFTDIITFDQREQSDQPIEADIFISLDRVKDNASSQSLSWPHELRRVMAHGLLHLIGFNDKTTEQQQEMRKTEDACLSLWPD